MIEFGGWSKAIVGGMAAWCVMTAAAAQELEARGREILEKNKSTVVTVQLVVKIRMSMEGRGSREEETKQEATGVVIDPTGLTVVSLSETDPTGLYADMMSDQIKMESEISDAKILTGDGTEIPAQIVLRDKDLDLAFVRPIDKQAQPLPCVDLTQTADAQVLDPLIALSRLGKVAGRAYAASIERIHAVVKKPRTFYVPNSDPTHSGLGSPVFALDGKIVGVIIMRSIKSDASGPMSAMGGMAQNMAAMIVPASDVREAAAQAPEKAPEKPKAEESAAKDGAKLEEAPTLVVPNETK